jgi:hypothetical protein
MQGRSRASFAKAASLAALLTIALPAAAQQGVVIEKFTNGEDADTPLGPVLSVGATVDWTYVVTNDAGGRDLTQIVVTDDQGVSVTCPQNFLGPGESMTCTASGTVQAGQYANVGMVTAMIEGGGQDSASDPSHYFGQAPGVIDIQKSTNGEDADTPPGPAIPVGDPVSWTYVVTNLGSSTLTDVVVTDDQGVSVTCPQTTLAEAESMTCTANGTAQPGQYANVGTVTAMLILGSTIPGVELGTSGPVAASDPSHYFGQTITLLKSTNGDDANVPPGPSIPVGSPVSWAYVVTNPGPEDLTGIVVTDDQGVVVTCPQTTLPAGESMTCTADALAEPGQYANVGTVTAALASGPTIMASDPSHYFGQTLVLQKSTNGIDADVAPGPSLKVGDPVGWTYVVTNLGTETLTDLTVSDDQGVAVSCPKTTLAPGESMTCTGSGTVEPGPYENLGIVNATSPSGGGQTITASDPSHYFGRTLIIEKFTNGEDADVAPGPLLQLGDVVVWTYVVTNLTTTALANVMVSDDQGVTVVCPKTTLAIGESMTCTANGTVAALGLYENIGTVTATRDTGGDPISDSDPSHYFGFAPAPAPALSPRLLFLALAVLAAVAFVALGRSARPWQ